MATTNNYSARNKTFTRITMRTAEFVSPMHPDKICDQISDAILDECLRQDPDSRVAIEVMGGHEQINIIGEVTTKANVNLNKVIEHFNLPAHWYLNTNIVKQSPDIAKGVDTGGAGDQGIMIGYACNETIELMPREYSLARDLCSFIYQEWKVDGKTQITIRDDKSIHSIIASFHGVKTVELGFAIREWLLNTDGIEYIHVNPAGEWDIGGFDADTGLTGRKIVVDAYGPRVPVGGGAFSGKDPSKVDRSAAYMARKIAIDYLKKYGEKECRVELAYAIGKSEPIQAVAYVDGNPISVKGYDLTPRGIIGFLDLKRPIYEQTARWGHFGNNFPWDN